MIEPSVRLFIQVRTQGEETQRNILTAVFLAQSFAKDPARKGILASMRTVFSSHGYILHNTEQGFARTRLLQ
jgi:hypothetical protein